MIEKLFSKKILVLDGAMGTMVQRYNLEESDFRNDRFDSHDKDLKGNNDLLCITQPEIVREIHRSYLEAGADIIETNTFNSNAISQMDYGTQDLIYELNYEAARIAKSVTKDFHDSKKFVAGAIGPTSRTASLSPDVNKPEYRNISFDELNRAYYDQAKGLLDGGVDLFLIETVFDTLNCKAALFGVRSLIEET